MARKRALIIGLGKIAPEVKQQMEKFVPLERLEYLRGLNTKQLQEALATAKTGLEREGIALEDLLLDGHVDPAGLEKSGERVRHHLKKEKYDVVLIGAGIRVPPSNFPLFERLMNIMHYHAPDAKIAFNTYPLDTADAIRRVLSTTYAE
eukprot:s880_g6.t1